MSDYTPDTAAIDEIETEIDTGTEQSELEGKIAPDVERELRAQVADPDKSKQLVARLPKWKREAFHDIAERRGTSAAALIRDYIDSMLAGEDVTEHVRRQIKQQKREQRVEQERIALEKQRLERREQELADEHVRTNERFEILDEIEDEREAAAKEAIEDLEEHLYSGGRIWADEQDPFPRVAEAADLLGKSHAGVINLIKERNPEIPDHAFEDGRSSNKEWNGIDHNNENR